MTGILLSFLSACSGSETYRGSWKAVQMDGKKFGIVFEAKSFSVKDSSGSIEKYDYTQNSVNINNGVKTYGIKLKDGRGYEIHFPNSNNESTGIIKDENGNPTFTISRTDYLKYEDIYKLK